MCNELERQWKWADNHLILFVVLKRAEVSGKLLILWRVDPLLGNDRERSNCATAVDK
jgi:hypothetical protein